MVAYEEGSFVNARQQTLHTVAVAPGAGTPIAGVIFWLHGFGEYSGRYKEVFTRLAEEAHVVVLSHDYHGHGLSEPKDIKGRAYINEFADLLDDSAQYLELSLPKYPGVPWLVAGHSLGGLLAVHLLLTKHTKTFSWAGLVLDSAAIDVEWTPVLRFQAAVGDCLASCMPFAKLVPAVRPEDMNPDPEAIKAYLADPLIYQGNVKARSANEILKGFKKCVKIQSQITVPIYASHGTMDKTTSLSAVKRLVSEAASKDKTLLEIEGGYHEVLFGPKKEEALAALLKWVKAHVSTPAASAAEPVVKPAADPVAPPVANPAADPLGNSVANSLAEPVANPVAALMTEGHHK